MLNPDLFITQTPNALDPGDERPTLPARGNIFQISDRWLKDCPADEDEESLSSSNLKKTSWVQEETHADGESFNSIPVTLQDPMPSPEEARKYAKTVLQHSEREISRSFGGNPDPRLSLHKSIKIIEPVGQNLVRRKRFARSVLATVVFFCIIAIAIVVSKAGQGKTKNSSGGDDQQVRNSNSQRFIDSLNFLQTFGVSDPDALSRQGSPQYEAALWMADQDNLQYDIPTHDQDSLLYTRFIQRYTLAVFYFSLGGKGWLNSLNFLDPDRDECFWFDTDKEHREGDVGKVYAYGAVCNIDARVESILIPENQLVGRLPDELALLADLSLLALPRNKIHGSIPLSFQALSKMEYLNLRFNSMSGRMPDWMGESGMNGLRVLALSDNDFSGTLPPSLSKLKLLKTLALDDNLLSGSLEAVNGMMSLEFLYMENNEFNTTIDGTFLAKCDKIIEVDVSGNRLKGVPLPAHLLQHSSLQVLDMHSNELDGPLPTDILYNSGLRLLSLYSNNIVGQIPSSITNLRALTHLDLSDNIFDGTLPEALGNLTRLTYLFLSDNEFDEGPIPDSFANLVELRELSMSATYRNGPIPQFLTSFRHLILLDLSRNRLRGNIPEALWNCERIAYVLLNRNLLRVSLSPALAQAEYLEILMIDHNSLTGNLKETCQQPIFPLEAFVADCGADGDADIDCPCCTECCAKGDDACNNHTTAEQFDPMWEEDFSRASYRFSPTLAFNATS